MVSCREATQLTSAEFDRKLSARERIRLTIHRLLCGPCRLYRRQMQFMRAYAGQLSAEGAEMGLDEQTRARIRERLRGAGHEGG